MIPDDLFTTPGDAETWPQIGRGGHLRNQNGQALILSPGGKRHRIAIGGSGLDVFDIYDGPTIYGDQGSVVHTITEYVDSDRPIDDELLAAAEAAGIGPETVTDIHNSYHQFITDLGWYTELIECIVVNDNYSVPIASNIDKVMRTGAGSVVVDVKSGKKCERRGTAMQVAAYVDSSIYDPLTGERTPLGRIDRDTAYIFHYPLRGDRTWQAIPVDVGVGRNLLTKFFALRDDDTHLAAFGEPIAAPSTPSPSVDVEQPGGGDDQRTAATAAPPPTLDQQRARYKNLAEGDKAAVARYWEANDTDLTDPAAIAEAIDAVTNFHDINKPPTPAPAPTPTTPRPANELPDEGPPIPDTDFTALSNIYRDYPKPARDWIAEVGIEAKRAGLDFHTKNNRTTRRFHIMRALINLSDHPDRNRIVDRLLRDIHGDTLADHNPTGILIGALNHHQAKTFADTATEATT